MITDLHGRKLVVVGGSAGIGFGVAKLGAELGAHVILASRTREKVDLAVSEIGGRAEGGVVDITSEISVEAFFSSVGEIDYLVISASSVRGGEFKTALVQDGLATMQSKFWGPYLCAKHALVSLRGSITFFSGVLGRRPAAGYAVLASVNAAVEGLGRALALELAPVRVNTISPGLTRDTDAFVGLNVGAREAMFERAAGQLPVGRVGRPGDIAAATLALATNEFVTGTVFDIDGGQLLV